MVGFAKHLMNKEEECKRLFLIFLHMYFENRQDAGRKLAEKLLFLKGKDAAILALPRG